MTIKPSILYFFIVICFILTSIISVSANEINGWFGEENSGGGIAIADINKNGFPDLIVLNIDHPEGGNIGYYRIGFDIRLNKDVSQWSPIMKIGGEVPGCCFIDHGWFGEDTSAADIAIADLNNNGMPDLIIFHIDNPEGQDAGYYRVGWDLKPNGEASSWDAHLSDPIKVPGWFGKETQGAGIAIADLNKNGKLDLIVFNIQHFSGDDENYGNYRIGWDLNSKGEAQWDPYLVNANGVPKRIWSWFGSDCQGGDIAVADLNQNDKPEFIVFNIDHSDNGNKAYYSIVWDVNTKGDATKWDLQPVALPGWMGDVSSAAGIEVYRTIPNGANVIYFTVARFEPSFGVGASTVNHGVYYDQWICDGPCMSQTQGSASAETGSGFIEEPAAKPEQAAFGSLEENTDRMGMNIESFDLFSPDPLLCQQACGDNPDCKAFTYVKPGYQGPSARCYLKSSVPDATTNDCCISGVKGGGTAVVVQPGFILLSQPQV